MKKAAAAMSYRWMALVFASAAGASCSSKDAATTPDAGFDAGSVGDTVECAGDASPYPVDVYEANLKKVGQSSALTFNLVSSTPAPPEQGENTFVVQVTHADGSPFQGTLVIPYQGMWMPLHGHGAPSQPIISFDPVQNAFVLSDMDFFMLGLWRLELQAFEAAPSSEAGSSDAGADDATTSAPATPTDTATFYFCL
jgi:hypothetical protein